MNYWSGWMNWPLDPSWRCGICGGRDLTWGLVHGVCRCDQCHATYNMRNANGDRITHPLPLTKEEYRAPAVEAWTRWGRPLDELTTHDWTTVGVGGGGG